MLIVCQCRMSCYTAQDYYFVITTASIPDTHNTFIKIEIVLEIQVTCLYYPQTL